MFKKSLLAISLAAVSCGAMSTTTVTTSNARTYAAELFGSPTQTTVESGTTVRLTFDNAVDAGSRARVTYTLSDGVFAGNPTTSFTATPTSSGVMTDTFISGGNTTNSIVLEFEVITALEAGDRFDFIVPDLAELDSLGTEEATVTLTPSIQLLTFPTNQFVTNITAAAGATVIGTSDTAVSATASATNVGVTVGDRTKFSTANDGISATVTPLFTDVIFDVDGSTDIAASADGQSTFQLTAADEITITVSGTFVDNSSVCLVAANDTSCTGAIDEATIVDGVATMTVAGNNTNVATGGMDVLYVVDGETDISVSDYTIDSSVDFNTATFADGNVAIDATTTLGLAGLFPSDERINIITSPGAVDETFIRVTNTSASETTVFIDLTTQGGTEVTGQLANIPAKATVVYSSQDIADAVGVETWTGRGNALISTSAAKADIVIVPLIRTGGVLTNQASALTSS